MTDMREELAKHVYASMAWAYEDGSGSICPVWVEGGNSFAQDEARKRADAIIAALPGCVKQLNFDRVSRLYYRAEAFGGAVRYTVREDVNTPGCFHFYCCGSRDATPRLSTSSALDAAQAHHTTQIIAAFGLPKQEGSE